VIGDDEQGRRILAGYRQVGLPFEYRTHPSGNPRCQP
jgi:hypothetical protein